MKPLTDPSQLQDLTLFTGYIDPNLGYAFQNLGPILPAIIGAITGVFAMFSKQIKFYYHKLISSRKKNTSNKTPSTDKE